MSDKEPASLMPALYSHRLAEIQDIARGSGYAIAVHGSMQRDLDLIAVPWVERPVDPKRLVARLCSLLNLECGGLMNPEQRPHGRLVWTLMMGGACFMDLSVIPPLTKENSDG